MKKVLLYMFVIILIISCSNKNSKIDFDGILTFNELSPVYCS